MLKSLTLELQKINKDMDIGEKEFIKCENDLWIALIVTQQQVEEQISQLKGEIKRLAFMIEKLENVMNEENGKTFDSTLLPKSLKTMLINVQLY